MFGIFSSRKQRSAGEPIYFYDTARSQKEVFTPLEKNAVSMYSCGPTVYDHIHIGNLRSYLLPDLIKRTLIYNGYTVRHTINFTDFGHLTDDGDDGEDKMMKALKRAGKPATLSAMREVAEVYMQSFKDDNVRFGNLPPTIYAPASNYVREQIALIATLLGKGYAYETSDGVYFDVKKFPRYGVLGNVDIAQIQAGARIEPNAEKHHPADFALWKKGLLGWESVWGKGFPGWHIECSAMAMATLGKQIDIHTGGEDLKYTHHNGEIAQSESITGKQFVGYWLHNAHLSIDNTKIAKSLGNGIRLSGLEDRGYAPEVFRYWLLTSHYRSPVNFTFEALDGAKQALYRLRRQLFEGQADESGIINETYRARFHSAINDDLDTPRAVACMWELLKDDTVNAADTLATIQHFDAVFALGIAGDAHDGQKTLGIVSDEDIPEDVATLITNREQARNAKDFSEADRLREEINLKGYTLEDTPSGPRLTKA